MCISETREELTDEEEDPNKERIEEPQVEHESTVNVDANSVRGEAEEHWNNSTNVPSEIIPQERTNQFGSAHVELEPDNGLADSDMNKMTNFVGLDTNSLNEDSLSDEENKNT